MVDPNYKLMMTMLSDLHTDIADTRRMLLQLTTGQRDLLRMIEDLRHDLSTIIKMEIDGGFAHLETRFDQRLEQMVKRATAGISEAPQ